MTRSQLAAATKIAQTRLMCIRQVKSLHRLLDIPATTTEEIDRCLQEIALTVSDMSQQQIELKE